MLRQYQQKIVHSVGSSNAIVKMPTGSGKTIVAAAFLNAQLERGYGRSLVLVPTQDLVDQQSNVFRNWCPESQVFPFTGGLADPKVRDHTEKYCLVSTPQAFIHLQKRKPDLFGWNRLNLLIFDEVHHTLKDHPYRSIALDLKNWLDSVTKPASLQILGFSASLTYSVCQRGTVEELNRLCRELKIEKMESPSLSELEEGGYVPQYSKNVELERANEVPEGVLASETRKPHLIHSMFMKRVQDGTATSFSLKLWTVILHLEKRAKEVEPSFQSPLKKAKLSSWEDYANKLSKCVSRNRELFVLLEVWYTALRLLVQSWEEDEVLTMQWLHLKDGFSGFGPLAPTSLEELRDLASRKSSFFKLGRLFHHLEDKKRQKGSSYRCIVFVQQRITALILSNAINSDRSLSGLGIRSGYVASRDSRITPDIKVSKSMASDTIAAFRSGAINVIVATAVIEEGFDVPAANVVISYDHIKNSVELCQRFGRARQQDSAIVVLDERHDRPLSMLESVRSVQDNIVNKFDASQANSSGNEEEEKKKQRSREQGALRAVLDNPNFSNNPLQSLNLYVKKTKGHVTEEFSFDQKQHTCTLRYRTVLRSIQVTGRGSSKKESKKSSALALLMKLKQDTR